MRPELPKPVRLTLGVMFILLIGLMALGCGDTSRQARAAWESGIDCNIKGDRSCALAELGKAVRLKPDSAQYRVSLAYALMASKMYEQAAAELQAAIRIDPGNVEARRHLARLSR